MERSLELKDKQGLDGLESGMKDMPDTRQKKYIMSGSDAYPVDMLMNDGITEALLDDPEGFGTKCFESYYSGKKKYQALQGNLKAYTGMIRNDTSSR